MISFNPKTRLLESIDVAKVHRELVTKTTFHFALEMSLLQYQKKLFLEASSDPVIAAAQAQRLAGAQQLVEILLNIAEIPESLPKREAHGTLHKHD